ncbi:Bifunctional epoxide hydrolase 2 [Linum grandiflorum]
MEQIKHKFVGVGAGINLHVADVGTGDKVILLLHGFPEIWYSWRHQMLALSNAGYRAIAPDYRGYGLSDPPPNPEEATFAEFAADMAAVLDSLGIQKVVVVAKDFGAYVASRFAVVYPERMLGLVTMGIPYTPPGPGASAIMALFPEGFYARRWMVRPLYHNSGFQTALKVPYRSMEEAAPADMADPTVKVPAMLILGDKDYVSKSPGFEDYANNGVKHLVQDLKIVHLSEGSHFVQEQFPEQVNELVLGFLGTRIWS